MIIKQFINYASKHLTFAVVASVVVFSTLTIFFENVVYPLCVSYIDPLDKLDKYNFTVNGREVIKIGNLIKITIIGIILLLFLWQIESNTTIFYKA